MTVYNDLRFLSQAVESVLGQNFGDLELVIVDDGTPDKTALAAMQARDPRIRMLANPTNVGTALAANRGIETARSDIIVRLDADDVCEPDRVGRLVSALKEDPELGLVGSAVTLIDEADRVVGVQPMPQTDLEIRFTLLFHNPFYHSAVAFRRSCFEQAGGYIPSELVSQDHWLWAHMLPLCRTRNLSEPLTRYRLNISGLTASHSHTNPRARTHRIRERAWSAIGLDYDLYDNALAGNVSHFLRGNVIAEPKARGPAYRVIIAALEAFLVAPYRLAREEDAEAGKRLKSRLLSRMSMEPPSDAVELVGNA